MSEFDGEFFIDYSKLDDFQRQLIDRKNNRHMVVSGTAGSGKSLIALHKAKQVAALGKSYTIVCYTKTLEKYFEDGLKNLGLSNVYHYHNWPKNDVEYLIVDECQDFRKEEIDEIKKHGRFCFFFGDTAQSIMSFRGEMQSVEDTAHGLGVAADPLYFNYRLTKQVAKLAEHTGKVDDLALRCVRQGEKPTIFEEEDFNKQLDKISEIIKNRSLTNVGILLPLNRTAKSVKSVEYVKDYMLKKGLACEFKYDANQSTEMDVDFHSSNPKIMTYWCAKGLQFKDVFIPGCDIIDYITNMDRERSAFYVAMTRCCERLYLLYSKDVGPFLPSANSDLYNSITDDVSDDDFDLPF